MKMKKRTILSALILALALFTVGCGSSASTGSSHPKSEIKTAPTTVLTTESPAPVPASQPVEPTQALSEQQDIPDTDIRPEFKELMDNYEAFIDEYCKFMQSYMNSDPSTEMLIQYFSILSKYTEFAKQIDSISKDELTSAELSYYIEVNSRVSQKLLQFAG